jgi:hypothetical protein
LQLSGWGRRGRPGWAAFTVKLTDGCVWGWPVLGRHRPGGEPGERLSVRELLAWPYLAAIGLLMWLYRSWPRRVPDLARLTRTGEFGQLQSASAAWLERNFELVERGAPWLERAGCWVCDRCHTSWETGLPWLQLPRPGPWVGCGREVTVVYGFDGSLPGRLAGLAVALAAAGWGEDGYGGAWVPLRDLARPQRSEQLPEPPVWPCRWSPVPGLALPPGLELESIHSYRADRGWLDMGLGWVSRGGQAELVTSRAAGEPGDRGLPASRDRTRALGWPDDLRTAGALYQPVEIGGTGVDQLAARALARHQHAAAIRIKIHYYPNVTTGQQRLRRRLLPVR